MADCGWPHSCSSMAVTMALQRASVRLVAHATRDNAPRVKIGVGSHAAVRSGGNETTPSSLCASRPIITRVQFQCANSNPVCKFTCESPRSHILRRKPANLIVDSNCRLKICDLGLSSAQIQSTKPSATATGGRCTQSTQRCHKRK